MGERAGPLLALAVPVLAGLAYLLGAGAPSAYAIVNGAAFAGAAALILAAPRTLSVLGGRILGAIALVLLFLPLVTGPAINGIARWLPAGPFQLHAGMLAFPALAVVSSREDGLREPALLLALLAAFLQPDAATGLAVTGAAVGLYFAEPDWKPGCVGFAGFLASLSMFARGELPAQPYVERILGDAAQVSLLAPVGLLAAMMAAIALMARAGGAKPARYALAGSFAGFSIAALVSNYPFALVGYGAAPIIGFGLGLALLRQTSSG